MDRIWPNACWNDTVEALMRLMDCQRAVGEVVNIGNTEEITITDLAKAVKQRTASSSPIELVPYDQAYEPGFEDMMRRVPCVDKLQALTGFRPQIKLEHIIDRVSRYLREKRGATQPAELVGVPAASGKTQ